MVKNIGGGGSNKSYVFIYIRIDQSKARKLQNGPIRRKKTAEWTNEDI